MSFDEFMVPCMEPLKLLNSNDKMWVAFKDLEIDNKGYLNMEDVELVLSPDSRINPYVWRILLDLEEDEVLSPNIVINQG